MTSLVLTIAEADDPMFYYRIGKAVLASLNITLARNAGVTEAGREGYRAMLAARPAFCDEIDKARREVIEAAKAREEHRRLRGNYNVEYQKLVRLEDEAISRLRSLEDKARETT